MLPQLPLQHLPLHSAQPLPLVQRPALPQSAQVPFLHLPPPRHPALLPPPQPHWLRLPLLLLPLLPKL